MKLTQTPALTEIKASGKCNGRSLFSYISMWIYLGCGIENT